MKVEDIEDLKGRYLVTINNNKNDYPGQFLIGNLFYLLAKKYIALRASGKPSKRFFIHYLKGKCTQSAIRHHTTGAMPKKIATYLKLPNIKRYTGHCFRRSSAMLFSNFSAYMQMIKQLGRWRSDIITQDYVENSSNNRHMIFNGLIQNETAIDTQPQVSTSEQATTNPQPVTVNPQPVITTFQQEINEINTEINDLNWSDFDDDFNVNNIEAISSK